MRKTLQPENLALLLIDMAEQGTLKGKTLLQKRAFFVNDLLGLGIPFQAHFYGPYSPELDDSLEQMKNLGLVNERAHSFGKFTKGGFELKRYDYELTSDGKKMASYLKRNMPSAVSNVRSALRKLRSAGDTGDYLVLSFAAKAHHVLSKKGSPMTMPDIQGEASNLGWSISEDQTNKAVDFLKSLGLAKSAS
jgi:uncharacterized protein YwgA